PRNQPVSIRYRLTGVLCIMALLFAGVCSPSHNPFEEKDAGKIPSEYLLDSTRLFDASVRFSGDGSRVAYVRENCLVLDGKKQPAFGFVTPVVFSADGARVLYTAAAKQRWFTVVDGVKGPEYDL